MDAFFPKSFSSDDTSPRPLSGDLGLDHPDWYDGEHSPSRSALFGVSSMDEHLLRSPSSADLMRCDFSTALEVVNSLFDDEDEDDDDHEVAVRGEAKQRRGGEGGGCDADAQTSANRPYHPHPQRPYHPAYPHHRVLAHQQRAVASSPAATWEGGAEAATGGPSIIAAASALSPTSSSSSRHRSSPSSPPPRRAVNATLCSLGDETLVEIAQHLSAPDLTALSSSCRALSSVDFDPAWKRLYHQRWPRQASSPSGADSDSRNLDDDDDGRGGDGAAARGKWKRLYHHKSLGVWRIGKLKMFNGCWGFISNVPGVDGSGSVSKQDVFFHKRDIDPAGKSVDQWWLHDSPGISRVQKCAYWSETLRGRVVRYKERNAFTKGRKPQACCISFVGASDNRPHGGSSSPITTARSTTTTTTTPATAAAASGGGARYISKHGGRSR